MDIRLFKFLIFLGSEVILFVTWKAYPLIRMVTPIHYSISDAHKMFMLVVPIFLLLPEDNWIWIVEENPRGRKISLRSKSVKHLHLSTLYILGFSIIPLLMCISLLRGQDFYSFELTPFFALAAFVYGIFCAWKNFYNIKRYEALFAVAWDRRSSFFELFVGFKVSRRAYFFYSGFALLFGLFLMFGSLFIPMLFYHYVRPPQVHYDVQKHIAMAMIFHFSLVTGIWGTTLYTTFQLFFTRRLQSWLNKPRDDRRKH